MSVWGCRSTGRRNTGVKSLCPCFKMQGLTWSFVKLTCHFVQLGLRVNRQVGALRKVLSQQTIGVLIGLELIRVLGRCCRAAGRARAVPARERVRALGRRCRVADHARAVPARERVRALGQRCRVARRARAVPAPERVQALGQRCRVARHARVRRAPALHPWCFAELPDLCLLERAAQLVAAVPAQPNRMPHAADSDRVCRAHSRPAVVVAERSRQAGSYCWSAGCSLPARCCGGCPRALDPVLATGWPPGCWQCRPGCAAAPGMRGLACRSRWQGMPVQCRGSPQNCVRG
jgi:hypothetical protein